MNKFRKMIVSMILLLSSAAVFAQDNAPVEMATGFYQSGKIYVVVVVMSIVFLGIAAYLVMLDRKISKLEKEK